MAQLEGKMMEMAKKTGIDELLDSPVRIFTMRDIIEGVARTVKKIPEDQEEFNQLILKATKFVENVDLFRKK